jgi:hypothetical protein
MASVASAQIPATVTVQKAIEYRQTSPDEISVTGYSFKATVFLPLNMPGAPATATARLVGPGGISLPLSRDNSRNFFQQRSFPNEAALNAAVPAGTYVLKFS